MANIRKLSAFRQLSLNCESPKEKRHFLKKQLSEDLSEVNELIEKRSNLKNGNRTRHRPPDRPIRIAWDDQPSSNDEPVIVKKCKEIKRPIATSKLTKQTTIDKDSILYSKQDLAKRLREVFDDQEERKLNLNIFLTQNINENAKEPDFGENFSEISNITTNSSFPKITPPLLINNNNSNNNNNSSNSNSNKNDNRNIFQIRKTRHELVQTAQSPRTVVVTPIKETELLINNDPKPIDNVIIRPSTAAMKRERFQKRTNSAFNATIQEDIRVKPPLIRAASAPISSKNDKSKSKFIATKRKIKANRKKKIKEESDDEINNNHNDNNINNNNNEATVLQSLGNEVVTMVSLVSPSASDGEESLVQIDKPQMKLKKDDLKTKNSQLRKTIKTVSFQQSTIHAIRSFSASFPARRTTMANSSTIRSKNTNLQEKRATLDKTIDGKSDDEHGPKRKHLKDNPDENCMNETENNDDCLKFNDNTKITVNITNKTTNEDINNERVANEKLESIHQLNHNDNNDNNGDHMGNGTKTDGSLIQIDNGKRIQFGSIKEKECWEMFRKMTERGINVSYDAILRGMLTPTEYRLRNKEFVEN